LLLRESVWSTGATPSRFRYKGTRLLMQSVASILKKAVTGWKAVGYPPMELF
jgi:hypothetical protein